MSEEIKELRDDIKSLLKENDVLRKQNREAKEIIFELLKFFEVKDYYFDFNKAYEFLKEE